MNHRQQFKLEGPMEGRLIQVAESALRSNQVVQGFKPSHLKNLRGWKLHSLYGIPAPALDCSQSRISFYPTFSPVIAYTHGLSFSHKAPLGSRWLCRLDNPLLGPGWLLLGLPWNHPFSRLNKIPESSASPCRASASAEFVQLLHVFPVLGCSGLSKALEDERTWWWRQRQRRH